MQKFITSYSPGTYENLLDRHSPKKVGKDINKRIKSANYYKDGLGCREELTIGYV